MREYGIQGPKPASPRMKQIIWLGSILEMIEIPCNFDGTLKLTDNEENECADSSAAGVFFSAKCAHATKHHQQVKNN